MDFDRLNELGFEKSPKWHEVVLVVAFNRWWNIFIGAQCFVTFVLCTYTFTYRIVNSEMLIIRYLTDLCYLFETVCNVLYRTYPKLTKQKYVKTRGWFFIFIDFISVIPLDLLYFAHGYSDSPNELVEVSVIQNRLLRIYRIILLESFYETIARKPHQYLLMCIFQFTFRLFVVSIVLNCFWVLVDKSVDCEAEKFNCQTWYQINMLGLVLLNWAGKKNTFSEPWERVLASAAMLSGFFIVFCYLYPKIFYFSMQLYNKRALFYEEFGKLQVFFRNMVFDPRLEARILRRFNDIWSRGRVDDTGPLFRNIPLALKKEISADIYWEPLRHSALFREVSRNCKRSLTLLMKTEYYHPEEVIYYKGQDKTKMMFLVHGMLQIMAEENEEFPVLSFSRGSVFGEMSLFFFLKSQVILKCKSYSQLQILPIRAAAAVLKDYPKDKKLVFHNLYERLSLARYTQWRKHKFIFERKVEMLSLENPAIEDSVKWLKKQWRAIWESHERQRKVIKAKEEGVRLHSWHGQLKTDIKIEYMSNYLDLIVLSDLLEEKEDLVCFRTSFPWSINPSTQFLRLWYFVVLVTSLVPALFYPLCTAWTTFFPSWVYKLSFIVTLIFIIDVILKLFTAVQTKDKIITKFSAVLQHLSQKPTFYFDIIAAIPYQFIIVFTRDIGTSKSYEVGLLLHPALLKSYLLLKLKVPMGNFMDKITVFKNCLIYFLLLYWVAEVIQLLGVRNLVDINDGWIHRFVEDREDLKDLLEHHASVMYALNRALSIPDYLMYPDDTLTMTCSIFAQYFFFLFMCYFLSQLYGSFTVKIYGIETFQVLMKRISKFLENMYVSETMANRLLKGLWFQWAYDRADYLSSKMPIIETMPSSLRMEVYSETTFKTLRSCHLFEEESFDFLVEVIESSYIVAVPRGSVLVTYGHTSHLLSILHRGYCQMNSFIGKDVSSEIGRAIKIGPGYVFPLLSSICCVPSPVSVITTTDCEVIMIHMDSLLRIMFKYEVVKDLVEVLTELNLVKVLLNVEPGLLTVQLNNTPAEVEKEALKKTFERLGFCWKLFYMCCPKKTIFNRKFFLYWNSFYVVCLTLSAWLWPSCFGLFLKSSYFLIPVLVSTKLLSVLHIIFRFNLSYFNKNGLLVTHPVYTCLNYFTSGFLFDLIHIIPFYAVYLYGFADSQEKPRLSAVLVLYVQLAFNMNYVMGFLNDLVNVLKNSYFIRMLKATLFLTLTCNAFINLMMYLNTKWIFGGPYRIVAFEPMPDCFPKDSDLLEDNSEWDYYVFTTHWVLCCLTTNDYLLHEIHRMQLYLQYIQGFIGTFGMLFLYVWVASNSIFANVRGTIYQEKVYSFLHYLKYEKADEVLIKYANSFYNYEWSQTRGESLKVLCKHLPTHLHEELTYPIYRTSFARNRVFTDADEGFYKILATRVKSVFYNRGSMIMFQNEVQSDIFFVHRGKCFVYDWFLVLGKGSIMGDIKRTGVIQNKVYALTHVELLKISSDEFFSILNNFYNLEANFSYMMKTTTENFVKAETWRSGHQLRPVDSKDILKAFCLKKKEVIFEDESIFEDPENTSFHVMKKLRFSRKKKQRMWIIYPGTWKMKAYSALRVSVTIVTLLGLAVFSSFGALTLTAFIIVGVTDFFWLVVVILTFRVGITDIQNGDVITDPKLIAKNYARRVNGLAIDLVSLIPLELLAIIRGIKSANWRYVAIGRMIRVLRAHVFYQILKNETERLESYIYLKYFFVITFFILILLQSVALYVAIATEPEIVAVRNHHELKKEQFFAFVMAFEYVINFISSANLAVIIPNTRSQLHFFIIQSVIYIGIKCVLISKILSLFYLRGVATAYYKSQMLELESYLEEKDTSPIIIKEVLTYRTNLLQLSRSENMPSLLRKAPATIRIMVMRDVYVEHLVNCPLFEDVERFFLEQLVGRASRELYFPGQKIVEQGDVDHRMYFIHSGEVYVMGQTKEKAYVEYVIRIIQAEESFGEAQGLWLSIPHPYTYRARTLVDMLVIHSCSWNDMRRTFPDITKKIFDKAKSLRYI